MIAGLPLEYAAARCAARLVMRPDERLWQQLHAARSLAALLDIARNAPIAPWLSGIVSSSSLDEIELAFRRQWRLRVEELAGWTPSSWRAAVLWTRTLIDLPAIQSLATESTPPRWIAADPVLAGYAQTQDGAGPEVVTQRETRIARMNASPIAPIVSELRADHAATRVTARRGPHLAPALAGWRKRWTMLWPAQDEASRVALENLADLIARHVARFGTLHADDAAAARATLDGQVRLMLRQHPGRPVVLFAWLALLALDLERLRGECVVHAARLAGGRTPRMHEPHRSDA